MTSLKIGMAQILVEGGEPARNLKRALEAIIDSKEKRCDLVVLPETLDLGWTHPSSQNEAESIPGPRSNLLCEAAHTNNIWVCAGLTESRDEKIYNTAILINKNGEIVLKYSKINVLEIAFDYYQTGNSLSTIDTEFGTIGLNICSDNYPDSLHLSHSLSRMGAQLILSPSSWTVDYSISENDDPYEEKWIKPYKLISSLYENAIVGVTSVGYIVGGPYEGKKSVGCSLVAQGGQLVGEARFNEFCGEVNTVDLSLPPKKYKGTQFGKMLKSKNYQFDGLDYLVE
jgi:predicted amidohydrolase